MAIASINAASSTSPNWLKEAQDSLAASQNPGGLLGTLQSAKNNTGSIKSYLARSADTAANLAMISQNGQQAAGSLAAQMASTAQQKLADQRAALAAKLNPQQTNFNPPRELDATIYFNDGSSLDTNGNILTMANGIQIDTTTGQKVIDSSSIITMANGAYLDTKNNIMTLADGTRIDTVTGLKITA